MTSLFFIGFEVFSERQLAFRCQCGVITCRAVALPLDIRCVHCGNLQRQGHPLQRDSEPGRLAVGDETEQLLTAWWGLRLGYRSRAGARLLGGCALLMGGRVLCGHSTPSSVAQCKRRFCELEMVSKQKRCILFKIIGL